MFDLNYIVTEDELQMDFIADDDSSYTAIDNLTKLPVGLITIHGYTFSASSDKVFTQYKLWLTRPERSVGKKVDIDLLDLDAMQEVYEELLVGAYILTAQLPVSAAKPRCAAILKWLRSTDFFSAPASSTYHEAFVGGLLIHSLRMYNAMLDLHQIPEFANVPIAEATIGALVHDWCKIGMYEPYLKNVKNEQTGQWEKVSAYRKNPKGITLGHGATSMYLACRCFTLSPELAAAIRWHMGEYNIAPNEMDELHKANAVYPMCYLLQFADRLSCVAWNDNEGC